MRLTDLHPAFQSQVRRKLAQLRAHGAEHTHQIAGASRRRPMKVKQLSTAEERLALQMRVDGLAPWVREYQFHPTRRWKFDFAWMSVPLAVEVDGGTHTSGRHTRGKGYAEDCVKLNEALLLGWRVLRFTSEQVKNGAAVRIIARALAMLKTT